MYSKINYYKIGSHAYAKSKLNNTLKQSGVSVGENLPIQL